jgi:hypothetical protein
MGEVQKEETGNRTEIINQSQNILKKLGAKMGERKGRL